jgi:hypothetical protein
MDKTKGTMEILSLVKIEDGEPIEVRSFPDRPEGRRRALKEGEAFLKENNASEDEIGEWTEGVSKAINGPVWRVGTNWSIYLTRSDLDIRPGNTEEEKE